MSRSEEYDLYQDLTDAPEIIALFADEEFCKRFWGSFANVDWIKERDFSKSIEEQVHERLMEPDEGRIWGGSFRFMGGVIADIRNEFHGTSEDYMDWYCSSPTYGVVYDDVEEVLKTIGWVPYKVY